MGLATYFFWSPVFTTTPNDSLQAKVPDEDKFCKGFISLLQSGNQARALSFSDAGVKADALPPVVKLLSNAGDVQSIHLTEYEPNYVIKERDVTCVDLKYYLTFQKWSEIVELAIAPQGESYRVYYFNILPVNYSYENCMIFDLKGRSWAQYLFLGLAYLLFLTCAVVIVFCAQSNIIGLGSKIFWMLVIMVGSIQLNVFWIPSSWLPVMLGEKSNVGYFFKFITLFPSGITKHHIYWPWTVWISIPLGLICYYWKKPYLKGRHFSK